MSKARYAIATISTADLELIKRADAVKAKGIKHTDIYRRGLEEYIKELNINVDNG